MLKFSCPYCHQPFHAPSEAAGSRVACGACKRLIEIPAATPTRPAAVKIVCPACDGVLDAPVSLGGSKAKCPGCGQRIQIPDLRNKTVLAPFATEALLTSGQGSSPALFRPIESRRPNPAATEFSTRPMNSVPLPLPPEPATFTPVNPPEQRRSNGHSGSVAFPFRREELRAFVGSNANYYIRMWAGVIRRPNASCGFSFAAAFFAGPWLLYRRMYLRFFALIGISVVVGLVGIVLSNGRGAPALNLLSTIIFGIVCGIKGNWWYFTEAQRTIAEVRTWGLPDNEHLTSLSERGGTNVGAMLAGLAAGIFLIMCSAIQ